VLVALVEIDVVQNIDFVDANREAPRQPLEQIGGILAATPASAAAGPTRRTATPGSGARSVARTTLPASASAGIELSLSLILTG